MREVTRTGDALTMAQAAKRLGITRTTLRRLVKEGKLPVRENPLDKRERLIPAEAIEELQTTRGAPLRPRPRTLAAVADLGIRSDEVEEYLEANWHPC